MKLLVLFLIIGFPLCILAEETPTVLSLDEAMILALRQNINLQSVRERLIGANISLETAKSEFQVKYRPEVSGAFQQNDEIDQNYGLRISKHLQTGGEFRWQVNTRIDKSLDADYQTNVTLAFTQPLLKGRGALPTTQELVAAEQSARSRHRALLLAQQQLMINVASAYYGILREHKLIEVHQRALERARLLLQAAEAKLKVGMASKMDVFRAELQVLTAENGAVDASESFENTKRRFHLLLGVDLESNFSLSSTLDYQSVVTLEKEILLQFALENRLELLDTQENIEMAERRVKIARQNLYPPIELSVQYTFRGEGNGFDQSLELDDNFWGIGLNSSFNLDLARERAAYQQAQLALNSAVRALQSTQQNVTLDVLQAITSVQQAQARIELQKRSLRQTEKQLELAELRYKKGLSDNLDVIDAEEALIKANSNYYSAIVQHLLAKMKLKQATGELEVPFF